MFVQLVIAGCSVPGSTEPAAPPPVVAPPPVAEPAEPATRRSPGVRITPGARAVRLEAPLLRLSGPGPDVVLIGAVHIADPALYEAIGDALSGCDVVLYEGLTPDEGPAPDEAPSIDLAPQLEAHGLIRQSDGLARGPGWRRIDRSVAQIRAALVDAGADRALIAAWLDDRDQSALQARLIGGDARERALARLALLRGLGEAPPLEGRRADLYWEILIGSRDQRVIDAFTQEPRAGSVGILYGADHTADLEARLARLGWRRTQTAWLPAIVVPYDVLQLGPVQIRQLLGRTAEGR